MGIIFKTVKLDTSKFDTALTDLIDSKKCISTTADEILTQITTINGANGIDIVTEGGVYGQPFVELSDYCYQIVDGLKSQAENMKQQIEDYNKSDLLDKVGGSIFTALTEFGTGIVDLGESILDGGATLVGYTVGWLDKDWQDSIGEFIEKDRAQGFNDWVYSTDIGKAAKTNSALSNKAESVFRGAGTLAGYVVIDTFTAGTGTVVLNGLAGVGRRTESGLQNGESFRKAGFYGLIEGAKDAAITKFFQDLSNKRAEPSSSGKPNVNEGITESSTPALPEGSAASSESTALSVVEKGEVGPARPIKANASSGESTALSVVEKGEVGPVRPIKANKTFQSSIVDDPNIIDGQPYTILPAEESSGILNGLKNKFLDSGIGQAASNGYDKLIDLALEHPKITNVAGLGIYTKEQASAQKASEQFRKTTENDELAGDLNKNKDKINDITSDLEKKNDFINKDKEYAKEIEDTSNPDPTPSPNPNPSPSPSPSPNPSPNPSPSPTPNPGTSTTQFKHVDPNPIPDTNKDNSVTPSTPSDSTATKEPISTPTTTGPTTSITTPPSNTGGGNEATTGSTNTIHTGGGYTGTSGYTSGTVNTTGGNITEGTTDIGLGTDSSITGTLTEGTTSIEDVIKGSKVTKIPTSPSPVTTTSSSSGSSAVIPIAAGLSAAAAAGIGAKAYMDRKHNNDNGEDDEDEFDTDEWSGDDSVDIQYDEDTANGENYLDDDDDYSYQATSNNEEKYDARSSEELADLQ